MNAARRRSFPVIVGIVICILLVGAVIVSAQATPPPIPIPIGQNTIGNISDPTTPVQYSFSVVAPMSINIQVLAIGAQAIAPNFDLSDPSGTMILDTVTLGTEASVQGSVNLSSPGTYILRVRAVNNMIGQFLIATQAGAPLPPPTPLIPGQPVIAYVDPTTTRQTYSFAGVDSDVLLLDVSSASTINGPVITIRNADTGQMLGVITTLLVGVRYRIPNDPANYRVEVDNSGAGFPQSATLCLSSESGSVTCPPINVAANSGGNFGGQIMTLTPTTVAIVPTSAPLPTVAAVIDPNGACEVTPTNGTPDNIRSGPGANFDVIAQLPFGATAEVIGRMPDNSWLQVNYSGILGWISTTVVIVGGSCGGVPVIVPPVNLPTAVPPTDAPAPSATVPAPQPSPTQPPNNNPTATPRFQLQPTLQFVIPTATSSSHIGAQAIGAQSQVGLATPIFHIAPVQCPGAPPSHLFDGIKATVVVHTLNIYTQPSLSTSLRLATEARGATITITSGPYCSDNTTWWYVHLSGSTYGYTMENTDETYNLQPAT